MSNPNTIAVPLVRALLEPHPLTNAGAQALLQRLFVGIVASYATASDSAQSTTRVYSVFLSERLRAASCTIKRPPCEGNSFVADSFDLLTAVELDEHPEELRNRTYVGDEIERMREDWPISFHLNLSAAVALHRRPGGTSVRHVAELVEFRVTQWMEKASAAGRVGAGYGITLARDKEDLHLLVRFTALDPNDLDHRCSVVELLRLS